MEYDQNDNVKDTMSLKDIISMYRTATYNIFVRQGKGRLRWAKNYFSIYQWLGKMRSQDGLKQELEKIFGDTTLNDIAPSERNNWCIAAAVASEFNQDANNPDNLEIFDTTMLTKSISLTKIYYRRLVTLPYFSKHQFKSDKRTTLMGG